MCFRNRVPKSSISNLWLQILFHNKFRYKYHGSPETSVGGLRIGILCPFSLKIRLFTVFSANHSKNLEKQKMWKTIFRKKGIKSRCGGPRPKYLPTPSFLIETLWKNNFEVGGPLSTIWGLYFKSRNPKFLSSGKKRVFCVAVFFESATKTTVLFFRGAPKFSV